MNESAMYHQPESKFCFATSTSEICLRLRISKTDYPEKILVVYGGKYDYALVRKSVQMQRKYEDRLYAYYSVNIKIEDPRFVYVFQIIDNGNIYYYSEDGLTSKFDYELSYYNCFQYAYINDCDILKPVHWMDTATFYQIFVDRFNIGRPNKDMSYVNMQWNDKPTPKSFAGGDIKGITDKLPYLQDLGINAIYLTPIFKSVSNHKYDISDYYEIDKHFGDKNDFREFVNEAHSKGIRVVLDAVFNHCSEDLEQFKDVVKNGKASPYYDWFIINNERPLQYECFATCEYMPKFNTSNPDVRKFLISIATYWIKEFDIDGWRLDVSDEVSHAFWRSFRNAVKRAKPDCVLIGENWHDANIYLRGEQFDSIMNYSFTKACLDYFAFDAFSAVDLADKLNELLMRNTDTVNNMMLNLLDTHDTHRFLTRVNGNKDKLMSALALTYFFPGVPCLYYGTEIPLEGGYDPDSRRTFDWKNENFAFITLIKALTSLKHNTDFSTEEASIYSNKGLLVVERGRYTLVINESGKAVDYAVATILQSNNYSDNKLLNNGFVVFMK